MKTAFPQDPHLTGIAIAYKNPDHTLIADSVLPRVPVGSTVFRYTVYDDPATGYTLPETKVGPTGRVNRVELQGTEVPAETEDHAVDVPLSHYDINAASKNVDARAQATARATSIVLLRREVRVGQLVFDAAQYPTGNKEALEGAEQWNNEDYAGNVLNTIEDGLRKPLIRPNVLALGSETASHLRRLPEMVKAMHGTEGGSGIVSLEFIRQLFSLQEVVVGEGWVNTAKTGEAPTLARAWGPHMAAFYRDRSADASGGLTFGFTAEFGKRVAGTIVDEDMGMRGGERARVGESLKEVICAPHAGYFWEDCVA